ncbi:hypothetical protein IWX77_000750 [Cryobacterium sp. CAN_C2]
MRIGEVLERFATVEPAAKRPGRRSHSLGFLGKILQPTKMLSFTRFCEWYGGYTAARPIQFEGEFAC